MSVILFQPAPMKADEHLRRDAVLRSGLLSMQKSARLARLTEEARLAFNADWAAVVAILDDWQHIVASTGGYLGPHRRSACISSYAILEPDDVFCILDVGSDPSFSGSQFAQAGLVGFYAGASIVDDDGYPVGVVCITDRARRARLDTADRALLASYAARILAIDTGG